MRGMTAFWGLTCEVSSFCCHFFSGVRGADLFLTVLFHVIFSTSSLGVCVKINLSDETYVSGPKSHCTWLSVEIKHMDTSGAAAFGVPAVNNSTEVVHTFLLSLMLEPPNLLHVDTHCYPIFVEAAQTSA